MKVKIEFDLGEAVRLSGEPVYTSLTCVMEDLALNISEAGATEGDVEVRSWREGKREPVKVGSWKVE